jgi:hypothetical protein
VRAPCLPRHRACEQPAHAAGGRPALVGAAAPAARGAGVSSLPQRTSCQQLHGNKVGHPDRRVGGGCLPTGGACCADFAGAEQGSLLHVAVRLASPDVMALRAAGRRRCASFGMSSASGMHGAVYEAGWRRIADTSLSGSKTVRAQVMPTCPLSAALNSTASPPFRWVAGRSSSSLAAGSLMLAG